MLKKSHYIEDLQEKQIVHSTIKASTVQHILHMMHSHISLLRKLHFLSAKQTKGVSFRKARAIKDSLVLPMSNTEV